MLVLAFYRPCWPSWNFQLQAKGVREGNREETVVSVVVVVVAVFSPECCQKVFNFHC